MIYQVQFLHELKIRGILETVMKNWVYSLLLALVFALIGWLANDLYRSNLNVTPNPISVIKARPLEKYTIENLSRALTPSVEIKINETLKEEPDFTSHLISFSFDPTFSGKPEKKVTGLMNVPAGKGPFPLVVMFRGYVDQKLYKTGAGTAKAGEFLAKNGYITIAPDFLGYGGSDLEAENIFESRFQTYTTALALINSIKSVNQWDNKNLFFWGHSNGGQIALTVLEITGGNYPTVLWAPVSKPFPFSILAYTDESDDHGKLIRRELSKFEEDYDVELFSLANYFDRIKTPIQLNQGTNDDAVPFYWSNSLAKILKDGGLDITYIKYPGADHNLQPSWNQVILTNLAFFNKMSK